MTRDDNDNNEDGDGGGGDDHHHHQQHHHHYHNHDEHVTPISNKPVLTSHVNISLQVVSSNLKPRSIHLYTPCSDISLTAS